MAQQGNGAAVFLLGLPAKAGQLVQQRFDAARAIKGGWAQIIVTKPEFFMLGANAPLGHGLFTAGKRLHELRALG